MKTKRKNSKVLVALTLLFALTVVATSFADQDPPDQPAWRGNDGTTLQQWNFGDDVVSPLPDFVENPYGDPLLNVKHQGWFSSIDCAQGVWALSGEIDIVIPNRPDYNPYKEMWITLTWKPEADTTQPDGTPFETDPFLPDIPFIAVTFPGMEYMDLVTEYEEIDGNGWYHTTYVVGLWPNPPKEWVTIKGNILVDALSIDTYCIPEPATIALLSIGAFVALRRWKK